ERTKEARFFKQSVFELPLEYMIRHGYLTPPVKVDIPVTSYDFSELTESGRKYTSEQIEAILKKQRRLTPLIIKNIVDITETYDRQGVMIFSSTVKHAEEILDYLPEGQAKMILGQTDQSERDEIINEFKAKKIKYLVNVSVLTTGFDAPHVDVIAILRPTDSVSLYQQIIGRGLRLDDNKKDCFVLDYTGVTHDIYSPIISDKKPTPESVSVQIPCPQCGFENNFWGKVDDDGNIMEHYGRKCRGGVQNQETFDFEPCGYLFRFKLCPKCSTKNDISAHNCANCNETLVDADAKLKQARLSKNAHVLKPDSIEFSEGRDKKGNPYLEVRYYDFDAKYLSEVHYMNNETSLKKFNINFLRSHMGRPEFELPFQEVEDVIKYQRLFRMPAFVIARKQGKFWRITEKIFAEELKSGSSAP
ncbi:MAG: helicase-related protein, partial [Pseudomonadota bacterium]